MADPLKMLLLAAALKKSFPEAYGMVKKTAKAEGRTEDSVLDDLLPQALEIYGLSRNFRDSE
jgi:hypothetical protein